jgi:hypothetical protein
MRATSMRWGVEWRGAVAGTESSFTPFWRFCHPPVEIDARIEIFKTEVTRVDRRAVRLRHPRISEVTWVYGRHRHSVARGTIPDHGLVSAGRTMSGSHP